MGHKLIISYYTLTQIGVPNYSNTYCSTCRCRSHTIFVWCFPMLSSVLFRWPTTWCCLDTVWLSVFVRSAIDDAKVGTKIYHAVYLIILTGMPVVIATSPFALTSPLGVVVGVFFVVVLLTDNLVLLGYCCLTFCSWSLRSGWWQAGHQALPCRKPGHFNGRSCGDRNQSIRPDNASGRCPRTRDAIARAHWDELR